MQVDVVVGLSRLTDTIRTIASHLADIQAFQLITDQVGPVMLDRSTLN